MAKLPSVVTDGFTSLEGGMDGGSATNLVPRNKVSLAVNATMRSGYLNNRPGWNKFPLVFPGDDGSIAAAYAAGNFQGSGWYYPPVGAPSRFVSIAGRIYRQTIGIEMINVEDLTPAGDANTASQPKVWMCQSDIFMVIQDGLNGAFVYDGTGLRRSTGTLPDSFLGPNTNGLQPWLRPGNKEIPTGTAMACGYGRIWLVRGRTVIAGDILDASVPNSGILFTEILQFQDGFSVPPEAGEITGIIFAANIDTSTGQGPLQIHTASGRVYTINAQIPRTVVGTSGSVANWTQQAMENTALFGGSSVGQDCLVNVNNDTWFRSHDGFRSMIVASRFLGGSFGNSWGNTPQSREVNNILAFDTPSLTTYASGVWFNNRLLMTCSPQITAGNRYFQGLIALDFDLVGTLNKFSGTIYSTDAEAAYDGLWTGLNITQITKVFWGTYERCFLDVWDAQAGNQVWELSLADPFDNGSCPIQSWIETGSYNFNKLPNLKKLIMGDIWIDQLQGTVNGQVWWQPDQYPFWIPWQNFDESDGQPCGTQVTRTPFLSCQVPVTSPPQYRSRIRLQEPENPANGPETIYPLIYGYDFRFRIAWLGRCRFKGFNLFGFLQDVETTNTPEPQ